PGTPDWLRPLTEASYLMAAALGAAPAAVPPTGPPDSVDSAPLASRDSAAPDTADIDARAAPREPVRYSAVDDGPADNRGPAVDADDWVTPDLPVLPGPSLVALLAEAEASRDASTDRAESLDAELRALRQRLQETEQELERIRRTLRP